MGLPKLVLPVTMEDESSQGGTRVKGRVKITQDGDKLIIEIEVSTRRSGISGTGFGATRVALLNGAGAPLTFGEATKSVGATLGGVAEKSETTTKQLTKEESSSLAAIALVVLAQESSGFPSVDAFTTRVKAALGPDGVSQLPLNKVEQRGEAKVLRLR